MEVRCVIEATKVQQQLQQNMDFLKDILTFVSFQPNMLDPWISQVRIKNDIWCI